MSAGLGFLQAVPRQRKLAAVERKVSVATLTATLEKAADEVRAFLRASGTARRADGTDRWQVPSGSAPRWEMPAVARALMDATPLVRYPGDLTAGQHSLFIKAASGPVVMFAVKPGADFYAADLASMRGVRVVFGEYTSQVGAVQPALF